MKRKLIICLLLLFFTFQGLSLAQSQFAASFQVVTANSSGEIVPLPQVPIIIKDSSLVNSFNLVADDSGRAQVELVPGRYVFFAKTAGFYPQRGYFAIDKAPTKLIRIGLREKNRANEVVVKAIPKTAKKRLSAVKKVNLPKTMFTINVVDSDSKKAIKEALVFLRNRYAVDTLTTDVAGQVEKELPVDKYKIVVMKKGWQPYTEIINLKTESRQSLTVTLEKKS